MRLIDADALAESIEKEAEKFAIRKGLYTLWTMTFV